ncbi:MAG: BBP7 family outer membrane beta-barrel protein [Gemmataceae bacterium]|nr:BBP7 family outer membrane beta-barrel protein [Gemmataceae bacterium]
MRQLMCAVLAGSLLTSTALAEPPAVVEPASEVLNAESQPPCQRLSAEVEYVMWWLRQGRVPTILTTSSFASGGRLDQPDTRVVYGDQRLETRHNDRFIGTRFGVGYWFDPEQTIGIEGRAVFLERDSTWFRATSDGSQLLARPYFNPDGSAGSEIVAGPTPAGIRSGGFNGYSRIELFDQEANLMFGLTSSASFRLDLLAGVRFLQMRDRTDLTTAGKLLPDQAVVYGQSDHYRVHDLFYGGQLGLRGEYGGERWFVNFRGEAALGGNDQQVRTFGQRVYHTPAERMVTPVGLSVLPSNTGTFTRTELNGIYELNFNVGRRIGTHWRAFVGYTLLMWDSPIRSGDQVDLVVNTSQLNGPLAGPARPGIPFKEDFFWAQGYNVGLEFAW